MASFILPAVTALSGLFGSSKPKVTTTNTNSSSDQTTQGSNDSDTITQHQLSPIQQQLSQMFSQGLMKQYQQGTDLSGYRDQSLQDINNQGDIASKASNNILASRGLSFSPAAATTQVQNNNNRLNQSTSLLQSLPLLQRQMQQQNLQGLISGFSALPTDTYAATHGSAYANTKGTNQSTSTQSTPQNPLAGLFGGLGGGLAAILPGLFGGGNSGPVSDVPAGTQLPGLGS